MSFYYEKIDHVQVAIPKDGEEVGRNFYVNILRFKEINKPKPLRENGGLWLQAGPVNIHLGIEEPFVPATKAHPAIRVKGIQTFMEYLHTKNIDMNVDTKIPKAKRFYVNDPFGNRIEFIEWSKEST